MPKWTAGTDEVGRGPLAGPVVAAAVILDPDNPIEGLADSKKLSETKREALFPIIQEKALSYSIQQATVEEIDDINILQASLLAMRRSVLALSHQPHHVLVDGNKLPDLPMSAQAVIKGDQHVAEIQAASILAKVTRDRLMKQLDEQYPGYGLAKHKGYPTKAHREALQELGATVIHRRSFGPVAAVLSQASSNNRAQPDTQQAEHNAG
jgi:ribonuclease HII